MIVEGLAQTTLYDGFTDVQDGLSGTWHTYVLTNTAYVGSGTSNIYVTPNGGFSGFRSNLQYFPNETDPQTAWNIYANGYSNGDGSLSINNPYSVEVSLYNNGTEQGSYTF